MPGDMPEIMLAALPVSVRDLVLLKGLGIREKKGQFANFSRVKRTPKQFLSHPNSFTIGLILIDSLW
jgi:hypothetical protein